MDPAPTKPTQPGNPPRRGATAARIALAAGLLVALAGCGLEQDIDLELPPYEPQPAVEAYLRPGDFFSLLITRSSGFFDPLEIEGERFLENLLLDSAEVTIRWADQSVELVNQVVFDPRTGQVYNYVAPELVPENYVDSFYLDARLADGTTITGATKLLPPVRLDSAVVEFRDGLGAGDDTLARIFAYVTDPDPALTNRFHRILTYSPQDSSTLQDFVFTDEFTDQPSIPVGTVYFFEPGDTVYAFTTHVDADFEEYLLSVQLAEASNGNPFAQPSGLLSNVRGSADPVGIFTTYAVEVDTVFVPEAP